MAEISKFATHNEYPDDSIEGMDLQHLLHPSTNLAQHQQQGPVVHESASGVYIRDNHGKQYLEGMAGLWCTAIGYGQEELAKVAYEQMVKLNYSQLFAGRTNEPSVLLAERLKAMAPLTPGEYSLACLAATPMTRRSSSSGTTTTHWAVRKRKRLSRASAGITASPLPADR